VAGVVVDPVATNAELARTAGLEFPILSDPDLHIIDAYGLRHVAAHDGQDIAFSASVLIDAYGLRHVAAHDGQDIALSATVLIDTEGVVRWTSVTRNVRVRPNPDEVLAAIDALGVAPPR
jgi:peroxiredoxin